MFALLSVMFTAMAFAPVNESKYVVTAMKSETEVYKTATVSKSKLDSTVTKFSELKGVYCVRIETVKL